MKQLLLLLLLFFSLAGSAQHALPFKKITIKAAFYVRSAAELSGLRAEEGDYAILDSLVNQQWLCTRTYQMIRLKDGKLGWKVKRTDFHRRDVKPLPPKPPYILSTK